MPALTPQNDLVRSRNVTASEVYALLGYHPYSTPTKIFDRLSAPGMDTHEKSEAMSIGSYLEPYVARYAASRIGVKVRACTKSMEHSKVNLSATPDYYIIGKPMLMEIKVSSIMYGWTEDTLHPHYEYQARAQLACTGREICIVCALVGSTFYQIPVVRDMEKERMMLDAVDKFWHEHILAGVRPIPVEQTRLSTAQVTKGG